MESMPRRPPSQVARSPPTRSDGCGARFHALSAATPSSHLRAGRASAQIVVDLGIDREAKLASPDAGWCSKADGAALAAARRPGTQGRPTARRTRSRRRRCGRTGRARRSSRRRRSLGSASGSGGGCVRGRVRPSAATTRTSARSASASLVSSRLATRSVLAVVGRSCPGRSGISGHVDSNRALLAGPEHRYKKDCPSGGNRATNRKGRSTYTGSWNPRVRKGRECVVLARGR